MIANYKGKKIKFPDGYSADDIRRILDADHRKQAKKQTIEKQRIIQQVTPSPWKAQEAQLALSLLNGIKTAAERPETDYTQDIKRISTLINECKPIQPEKPVDYSDALKAVADKLDVLADKEFPEQSDDAARILERCEKLLNTIARKKEKIVIEAEKKDRIKGFNVIRDSAGDAKRFDLVYEGAE